MPGATAYAERRARVLDRLGPDAALVVASSPELVSGLDGEVRYLPDGYLYWLSGYIEPEAVLVLCPSCEESPFMLFVRPRDPERELWTGPRGGVEAAVEIHGADAAFPIGDLARRLPERIGHVETLVARFEYGRPDVDGVLMAMLVAARRGRPRTGRGPRTLTDPAGLLDPLRRVKDAAEIEAIRKAAAITVAAFREGIGRIAPGAGEWEIEAALEAGFRMRGASGPAFPSIVASGPNAPVLHHTSNDRRMRAGELVLVDAGARVDMYCADISRTLPVGGRCSPARERLVDIVRRAHAAALEAVKPGSSIADVHERAVRELTAGMVELDLLKGGVDELIEIEAYKRYYPHRTGHWLGIDVHDVGDYVEGGSGTILQAGMVLTVEPGLYIPADSEAGPDELRGSGVRLEDDVLVTADGAEVLTSGLPLDPREFEPLLRHHG